MSRSRYYPGRSWKSGGTRTWRKHCMDTPVHARNRLRERQCVQGYDLDAIMWEDRARKLMYWC